jgi:hypothetical protein
VIRDEGLELERLETIHSHWSVRFLKWAGVLLPGRVYRALRRRPSGASAKPAEDSGHAEPQVFDETCFSRLTRLRGWKKLLLNSYMETLVLLAKIPTRRFYRAAPVEDIRDRRLWLVVRPASPPA